MAWLIGIDEAGYGPNLGPLVVAATVWHVEDGSSSAEVQSSQNSASSAARGVAAVAKRNVQRLDLYKRLKKTISLTAVPNRIAIADSKLLYKPGAGLRELERAVLVALRASRNGNGVMPAKWSSLVSHHTPQVPWYADYDCDLPLDTDADEIGDLTDQFTAACGLAGVQLVDARVRMVFPQEFNHLTTHFGTKGAALSHVTIELVRQVLDALDFENATSTSGHSWISCDKHGGRNRYLALLQHHFPEHWIDILEESGPASRYCWTVAESRFEVCFRANGETELPVALASMTAKYHRELAMRAFNYFWCREIPELKRTAGYPGDSRRFKAAIAQRQRELGIEDAVLWRER